MDIVKKDSLEVRVFDCVEIAEYVDLPSTLPMAAEESRHTGHIDVAQQYQGRGRVGGDHRSDDNGAC